MNKRKMKKLLQVFTTLTCILVLHLTALAASPVIIAGGEQEEAVSEEVGGPATETGEAAAAAEPAETSEEVTSGKKGGSLGMFTTTGYCTCELCSRGQGLTYSGTVPKANHTISADLTRFPLGTRLMIGDIIYTVEDMGSSVKDNWIDIYYDNHDAAVAHGMKTEEVFTVIDGEETAQ